MSESQSQRELPEEQLQIDEDERKDEPDVQTMQRAEELSAQYEHVKDRTVDATTVLGVVEDIDTSPSNSKILVVIDLPGESEPKTSRFRKPKVWSEEYDFVRWIRYYGYDADSFPNMLQDQCEVEVETDGSGSYELYIPSRGSFIRRWGSGLKARGGVVKDFYLTVKLPVSVVPILTWLVVLIGAPTGLISLGLNSVWGFIGLMLISALFIGLAFIVEIGIIEEYGRDS